jgi:thioredoxin reductase (NADPH)
MPQADFDVIVIGEGTAGLLAARDCARGSLRVATVEANLFGGLVINVGELDPAPEGTAGSGADYAAALVETNAGLGVRSIPATVTTLGHDAGKIAVVTDDGTYRAPHVVVASGAAHRSLGVPGEAAFAGRGVSHCADCDGPLYRGADVVVVGGGDSALQQALVLASFCSKVLLVHRGSTFRARPGFVARVAANPVIHPMLQTQVRAIAGNEAGVTGVALTRDGSAFEVPCAAVFPCVGLVPNSRFVPEDVERAPAGHVITNAEFATSYPGVWAIGAVRAGFGGLIRDAAREAATVAGMIVARMR